MKSNIKRFLGILLAILMVVTILPTAAFADATVTGAVFTVGNEKYLLTDESKVVDGKTYYGVLNATGYSSQFGTIKGTQNAGLSTSTEVYLDLAFEGNKGWSTVTRNGESKPSVNLSSMADTLFPTASFGGYLLENDWTLNEAWPWTNGNVVLKTRSTVATLQSDALKTLFAANSAYLTSDYDHAFALEFVQSGSDSHMRRVSKDGTTIENANVFESNEDFTFASSKYADYFGVAYVSEDFFKNVKIDTTKEIGTTVKAFFADNFIKGDFASGLYTADEFEALGIKAFSEEVKPQWVTGAVFTVGNEKYLLTDESKVVDGKTYYGVLNATGYSSQFGTIKGTQNAGLSTSTEVYLDLAFEGNKGWSTVTRNGESKPSVNLSSMADTLFPTASFGGYLLENDWTLNEAWPWTNGNVVLKTRSTVATLQSDALKTLFAANSAYLTSDYDHAFALEFVQSGSDSHMRRVSKDGTTIENANVFESNEDFTFASSKYADYFGVAYVSEDFFKNTDIDMTTAGHAAKAILKDNFDREELTGWTKANLDLLFGGYDGEGLGLEVAKVANGAEVIIHNNGEEAAGKDNYLIVASYDANGMKNVKIVKLEANVSAGVKTSVIKVAVDVIGATEVKAMLWEDLINAVPVTGVVSAN